MVFLPESGTLASPTAVTGTGGIKRGYAVVDNASDGSIVQVSTANDKAIGIAAKATDAGETAAYYIEGIVKAVANGTSGGGGNIAVGDDLCALASGKLGKATSTNDNVIGVAKTAASTDNATILVQIQPRKFD